MVHHLQVVNFAYCFPFFFLSNTYAKHVKQLNKFWSTVWRQNSDSNSALSTFVSRGFIPKQLQQPRGSRLVAGLYLCVSPAFAAHDQAPTPPLLPAGSPASPWAPAAYRHHLPACTALGSDSAAAPGPPALPVFIVARAGGWESSGIRPCCKQAPPGRYTEYSSTGNFLLVRPTGLGWHSSSRDGTWTGCWGLSTAGRAVWPCKTKTILSSLPARPPAHELLHSYSGAVCLFGKAQPSRKPGVIHISVTLHLSPPYTGHHFIPLSQVSSMDNGQGQTLCHTDPFLVEYSSSYVPINYSSSRDKGSWKLVNRNHLITLPLF